MKKIRSTDDEHISKKLFLFFSYAIQWLSHKDWN
jgi:hypothetical protein